MQEQNQVWDVNMGMKMTLYYIYNDYRIKSGVDVMRKNITSTENAIKYIEKYWEYNYIGSVPRSYGIILIFSEERNGMGVYHRYLVSEDLDKAGKEYEGIMGRGRFKVCKESQSDGKTKWKVVVETNPTEKIMKTEEPPKRKAVIKLVYDIYDSTDEDDLRNCLIELISHSKDSKTCDIGKIDEDSSNWESE